MKEEILEKARKQRDGLEENIQKIEEENRAEMEKKLKEIKLLKKEMREKKENGDKEMKMMKEEGWKCHRKVLDHEIEQLEEEERKQKVANTERIKLLRKEMRDKGEEAKSDLDFIKKEGWLTHKVSLEKEMKRLDEEERKEKATKQEITQLQKEEMRRNRERAKRDLKALNKNGYKRQQEALIRERNKVEEEERKQMEEKQHRVKLQRWDVRERLEDSKKELKAFNEKGWKRHRQDVYEEMERLEEKKKGEQSLKLALAEQEKSRRRAREKGSEKLVFTFFRGPQKSV
ncbi:hypothetical protein NHX12_012302 [Muraenolepis orangiensis]|uniref:Uncharacterized protein n=1 Tax=Muraenolepis orangiensis TaxID=630683 RepID=A0A9Q0I4R8_9TELE|nr:hypothetical protein NHX12_012302 [Muraenolepis orangiensis]